MIPQDFITEWSHEAPWQTNEQIEQDLVICRALEEIFSDDFLSSNLAFRGGTALHKLYLQPPSRYSEDIDLVQISSNAFGPVFDKLRERLKFLGEPKRKQKQSNNTLIYFFESEFPPVRKLKLKVETNCREHFAVLGYKQIPFEVNSSWFQNSCKITTYTLTELLGSKLRALYQRKKGRDLYDIFKALHKIPDLDTDALVECYRQYMRFVVDKPPSRKVYLQNIDAKMQDTEFLGDIAALLRPDEIFNWQHAYELVKTSVIEKI